MEVIETPTNDFSNRMENRLVQNCSAQLKSEMWIAQKRNLDIFHCEGTIILLTN